MSRQKQLASLLESHNKLEAADLVAKMTAEEFEQLINSANKLYDSRLFVAKEYLASLSTELIQLISENKNLLIPLQIITAAESAITAFIQGIEETDPSVVPNNSEALRLYVMEGEYQRCIGDVIKSRLEVLKGGDVVDHEKFKE